RLGASVFNRLRNISPAHILEHHTTRQQHTAAIDVVIIRIVGSRAVRSLEHSVTIPDVRSRRNPESTHLSRTVVGKIVAVEIWRRDDVIFIGTREYLLKH